MARWYVNEAERQVNSLRQRLAEIGYVVPTDSAVEVELIAEAYLDCTVFRHSGLNERTALAHLREAWGLNYHVDTTSQRQLAGALYVTADGSRAIFLAAEDSKARQRFSLAHELGHLLLEAEVDLEPESNLLPTTTTGPTVEGVGVRMYGRCPPAVIDWQDSSDGNAATPGARVSSADHSASSSGTAAAPQTYGVPTAGHARSQDIREWRANFFAAELLMPYAGVRRIVQRVSGGLGFRTDEDLNRAVVELAETYAVSVASARLRLVKDLRITPSARDPNRDLFG